MSSTTASAVTSSPEDSGADGSQAPGTAGRRSDAAGTPPDHSRRRARVLGWGALVLVGLLLAIGAGLAGLDRSSEPVSLDPTSTTRTGTRALVRVLEQQGTPVDVVHDAAAATDRARSGGTVFVDDSAGTLSARTARELRRTADRVVLVTEDSRVLDAFRLRATPAAQVDASAPVDTRSCTIPAAADARTLTPAGIGFSVPSGATRCLASTSSGTRTWGIVRARIPHGTVTLLGATSVLQNGSITAGGNAAFALNLLGNSEGNGNGSATASAPRLTWFVPTAGADGAAPALADLAPRWITPVLLVGALVALAAAFWRGRRLGPLVVERLPVVVRAAETAEGRARLYARTRDRGHALDTLRMAAIRRIGRRLGLFRGTHVDAVVHATARATGRSPAEVGAVLVGRRPDDDRSLVAGADAIVDLERAVIASTTSASATGTSTSTSTSTSETMHHDGGRP
jgi:hypothetical protein